MADIPRFDPAFFSIPEPPELPDLEFVDLTVSQIKAMSDAELLSILSGESEHHQGIVSMPLQQLITSELLSRTLAKTSKPHWSVVPSFWLLIATTVLAIIATAATVLALPQLSTKINQQKLEPAQPSAPLVKPAVASK